MQTNPPVNRLQGALPKVGIRPVIDGRRQGVRESMEAATMAMARAAAELITERVRHACGLPVECVIADTCIGGIAEAAACEAKFEREGVGVSLTVARSWCYGYEVMDMHPTRPKAIWGFNGTERPGAVFLAAAMAAHANKRLPAFSIYGREVQDADDFSIPPDVAERIVQFVQAGLAVATMQGKTYVSMGNVSMGIVGSLVDQDFLQRYLGMRTMTIDMVEFVRRIERGIYDPDEFERAYQWVRRYCTEGKDYNPPDKQLSPEQKERTWRQSIQMALIARDLMVGNPKLAEMGYAEEALGFNGIASGFQGQRQWTDHFPNGDFMEAILCSSFDWNGIRQPYILATENDYLNGMCMLFGHLLTGAAQVFRGCAHLLVARSSAARDGLDADRRRRGGLFAPHQLRSCRAGRHRAADRPRRNPHDEGMVGGHARRGGTLPASDHLALRDAGILPRRGLEYALPHARRHARHDVPPEHSSTVSDP
jgi:L-fucose/D-arabinose isomerase